MFPVKKLYLHLIWSVILANVYKETNSEVEDQDRKHHVFLMEVRRNKVNQAKGITKLVFIMI